MWSLSKRVLGPSASGSPRAQVSCLERSYRFFWRHKGDVYHVLWDLCRCGLCHPSGAPPSALPRQHVSVAHECPGKGSCTVGLGGPVRVHTESALSLFAAYGSQSKPGGPFNSCILFVLRS